MKVLNNYLNVVRKIKEISQNDVTVVAVSKYAQLGKMKELYDNNVKTFGESRLETFKEKSEGFPGSNWHMIGSIQTRKVKDIIGSFDLIHSLDREKLAKEINKRSKAKDLVTDCLIQVNIAKEESKSGLYENEVEDFLDFLRDCKNVNVKGLMTMAPYTETPEEVRYVFKGLKKLQVSLYDKGFTNILELSMGMSNDYHIAVEEGATIVRVGSEIFN